MRHRIPQSIATGGLIAGSPQSIVTGGLMQPINRFAVGHLEKSGTGLAVTAYHLTIEATLAEPPSAEVVPGERIDDLAVAALVADAI
jgi:hypothetical protein